MSDICGDNRFELIKKYKQMLIENTNIEMAKDEMAVIDNILFRFWQMNWLDKLEQFPSAQPETAKRIVGKSRDGMTLWYQCDMCDEPVDEQDNYCRGCGRRLIDG